MVMAAELVLKESLALMVAFGATLGSWNNAKGCIRRYRIQILQVARSG
jgi:hypothetical protein